MSWRVNSRRVGTEDRRAVGRMMVERLKFLQSVIDSVTDPILVIGTNMEVKLLNQAARDFSGFQGERWRVAENSLCYRVIYGSEKSCLHEGRECPLMAVLETGNPMSVVHEVVLPNGEHNYYEVSASPLSSGDLEPFGIIEFYRDITERVGLIQALQKNHAELESRVEERTADLQELNIALRQEVEERKWAEDQLIQSLEHAELVYRVIPSATFTVDTNRVVTSWNDKAEEVTGYRREEVVGKPCSIFARYPCTVKCGVFADDVAKPILGRECEISAKDGRTCIISKNADLVRDADGLVIGAVESFEDVTLKKDVERQLRTERDKLHSMLSAMGHGMHILNRDFEIEYQNEVLRHQFGDKLGEKCYQVYKQRDKPCEVCRMHAAIESGAIQRTEEIMTDGRFYEQSYAPFMDVDGQTKALILLRDITEEKAFQAETMRAGQLASIGELAAGVAHEINNPINGIINYAQVLLDEMTQVPQEMGDGSDHVTQEVLQRIIKEGERIAAIVGNLLAFARQREKHAEAVAVGIIINDALALIKHQLQKDGIQISLEVPDDLPPVVVNPQQLQQVFLNLFSNARHALNQRYKTRNPAKRLEVRGTVVSIEGKPYVRTTVIDYGTGIAPEILDNIFDPFFSSKKPGEGTGLGLSISHSIIREFKGLLHAESETGRSTAMMVDLPAARPDNGLMAAES